MTKSKTDVMRYWRLIREMNRTNYCLSFSTQPVVIPQLKDTLPSFAKSMCIYETSCSRGESYIGCTTR